MPRWEPDARERLIRAAIELYATVGYEETTVGEIAARAGVTSRTYNRYFPDKREVLFSSSDALRAHIVGSVRESDPTRAPLVAVLEALAGCEDLFQLREHDYLAQREALIARSEHLREREARKLATIAAEVAEALREREVPPDQAMLVADLGVVVFKRASRLWMDDPHRAYSRCVDAAAGEALAVLVASDGG